MQILNISGYRFVELTDLAALQTMLQKQGEALGLKGTILLSAEGININLSASMEKITAFKSILDADVRFTQFAFHEFYSAEQPFRKLKVKIKKEIITFRQPDLNVLGMRAPALAPEELKQWLDEKRDITLLDTRNEYEISMGTFDGAVNLHLNHFNELPKAMGEIDPAKPVVMFCTGGIRCEKAAQYMKEHGFPDVYQLDGGILGYFAKVGGAHYSGGCFVFDERVSVEPQ